MPGREDHDSKKGALEEQLERLEETEPSLDSVIDDEPTPRELESLSHLERFVSMDRTTAGLPGTTELHRPSLAEIEDYREDILEIARAQRRAAQHSAQRIVD